MSDSGQTAAAIRRNQAFYDRWRLAYELFTRRIAPLRQSRRAAAAALGITDGTDVLECGCGPGPNMPFVLDRMAGYQECSYLGMDIAPKALGRARRLAKKREWREVSLMVGDATDPPIYRPVDAILSTFVVTIFPDPATVVRTWMDHLKPGGRLVLLNTHPSPDQLGTVLNPAFNAFVILANPISPKQALAENPPWELLSERVNAAESAMQSTGSRFYRRTYYGGLVSLAVAER